MCDAHGVIRFHLVFEWLLPMFGDEGFYKLIAGRMRKYMIHIMKAYFDSMDEKYIQADQVTCFFGCQLVRSTREALDAVRTAKESMPCGVFSDMQ